MKHISFSYRVIEVIQALPAKMAIMEEREHKAKLDQLDLVVLQELG